MGRTVGSRNKRPNRELQEEGLDIPTRPNRGRINRKRDILKLSGVPKGYTGCWINDIDTEIQDHLDDGWEFLYTTEVMVDGDSARVGKNIGTALSKNGGYDNLMQKPYMQYAMCIPTAWLEEDEAIAQREITERENLMRKSQVEGGYGKVEIS